MGRKLFFLFQILSQCLCRTFQNSKDCSRAHLIMVAFTEEGDVHVASSNRI
jgi:hypothetical protein